MTTVLFAIDNAAEQAAFRETIAAGSHEIDLIVPDSIAMADEAINGGTVDVIVTDLRFHNGGFAEWLFLWQHPFVLLADWDEYERIGGIVTDQSSDFAIRDTEMRHIQFLPLVIRRLLNSREAIERHNVTLRMTEERYRELVQALPDIIYTLDGEGRFAFVNDSIKRLGWNPVELIGRHFSVILDPEDVPKVSRDTVLQEYAGKETGPDHAPKLFDERRTGERRTRDLLVRLKRKGMPPTTTELYGSVIAYGEVNSVGFTSADFGIEQAGSVGIIRDVSERRQAEEIMRRSLREKETLLAEIHHRVKNNLQVISSLLNLQSGALEDTTAQAHFADAQMQIQSIALVHEHLYRSGTFESVGLRPYVESLCDSLFDVYGVAGDRIRLDIAVEPIHLPMQKAMPVALMLNELVSNSLKYAFPDGASGVIHIRIGMRGAEQVELEVRDDGVGLPEDFGIAAGDTLGHTLLSSLANQLEGTVAVDGSAGTQFLMRFPL